MKVSKSREIKWQIIVSERIKRGRGSIDGSTMVKAIIKNSLQGDIGDEDTFLLQIEYMRWIESILFKLMK